jgi:peptide-methionine (S)-S-oxide reductase
MATATATFGAGCFWQVEVTFRNVEGVRDATVGYMGGHTHHPSYEEVCTGATGHAEVCQVTFDPAVVSYEQLLEVFFDCHDPTQLNRQGPDVGTQYRSVIFVHDDEQKEQAPAAVRARDQSGAHQRPVVTAVEPAGTFWPAEEYHQQYLVKKGLATCRI